ncbi:permease [bacterium]|nr:permease [bacterium]
MSARAQWRPAAWILAVFAACYYLPVGAARFDGALLEAFHLVRWYAREHVLLCLVPAFAIAGAIAVFVRQGAVMRYLGPRAPKALAYGVASVSGSVLAVCSCTVLPLFAGISRMGAGLGPATAFLYAGPAVNVLAIILTTRVLGVELGIARAVGAVVFSVVIGLLMGVIFRREEAARPAPAELPDETPHRHPLEDVLFFASLIAVLVFANWHWGDEASSFCCALEDGKWWLVGAALVAVAVLARRRRDELGAWAGESWGFARQILPLLLAGVLVAGLLLGRPGHEGLVPSDWVARMVGGNGLGANLFASVAGALMYFATLTEVPILEGLLGAGMGKGPALALLLAGPALSLPNMLVIRSVLGTRKTLTFVALVVVMATLSGLIYGSI